MVVVTEMVMVTLAVVIMAKQVKVVIVGIVVIM